LNNYNCSWIKLLILYTFATIILAPLAFATPAANIIEWSPKIQFLLPGTDAIISFSNTTYFTSFEWDCFNASSIKFYNLKVYGDNSPLPYLWMKVENANATILYANFDGATKMVLYSGDRENSTVHVCSGSKPVAVQVGDTTIVDTQYLSNYTLFTLSAPPVAFYDSLNKTLIIRVLHYSPMPVTVFWAAATADALTTWSMYATIALAAVCLILFGLRGGYAWLTLSGFWLLVSGGLALTTEVSQLYVLGLSFIVSGVVMMFVSAAAVLAQAKGGGL
jgi:hypothetical protein